MIGGNFLAVFTCEGVREDPDAGDPAARSVHGEGHHDGADHGDGGGPGGHGHARLQCTEAQPGQILPPHSFPSSQSKEI